MILRNLQALLGGIYDVPLAHDVYDFLVTDRSRLPGGAGAHPAEPGEQLLVAEADGAAALALFIDPAVLARLERADPTTALHAGNLADCWTALEGVSHFLYLAWNAGHDRPVSLLELELQAEVDKYIVSLWLLRSQNPQRFPAELHSLLFERARVDAQLARERMAMYLTANQYAARFCRMLETRLRAARRAHVPAAGELMTELRRFYRLSNARKLSHIDRHA